MSDEENFLYLAKVGEVFSWETISTVHRIRNGIYQKKGRLISLLTDFGKITPCYPDFQGETEDVIFYTGAGRRGDQKLDSFNQALLNAIETEISVPLFNKLAVGQWEFTGFWKVCQAKYIFDKKQNRMLWKFRLEKKVNN